MATRGSYMYKCVCTQLYGRIFGGIPKMLVYAIFSEN